MHGIEPIAYLLGIALIVVPLAKRSGLPAVIGYLSRRFTLSPALNWIVFVPAAFTLIDPTRIADVNRDGRLTATDAALVLAAIAGPDEADDTTTHSPMGAAVDLAAPFRRDALRGARVGVLRGPWGWTLFGIVWTLAALGVLFKVLFGSGAMAKLSTAIYVAMGWVIIIAIKPLMASMAFSGWRSIR